MGINLVTWDPNHPGIFGGDILVGEVVGLLVELGFGGLVICALDKKLGKMQSTIDGPWRSPPSYGRYGSTPPATKHATIN
jgi:hypothetical protein